MKPWFALLLSLCLGGCALLPEPPRVEGSAPAGRALAGFTLEGRIAVRTAPGIDPMGQQGGSFSGGIVWQREGARESVLLRTPLGQGVAQVEMGPQGASLTDAEGRRYEADDAEVLLQRVLGWSLPLSGLSHWVIGRPDPARPFEGQADAEGRWRGLVQDGWRIEYDRYVSHLGSALPGRMVARRGDGLEIRLVVDTWQIR